MEKKILIGLSTGEYVRRADFIPHFIGLLRPVGSATMTVHGQSPASSRNAIIEAAFKNDFTHIFFLDDDMVPPANTLEKLMAHDVDIVSALYLSRAFPHRPVFFDQALDDGYNKHYSLVPGAKGLIKGTNCGFGAVLISIEVFKKLEQPYVRLGEIVADGWCDDIGFFNRCRAVGYDVYCDLDAPVGHMGTMTMWPEVHDGKWMTNYKQQNGNVLINQNVQTKEEIDKEFAEHEEKQKGAVLV